MTLEQQSDVYLERLVLALKQTRERLETLQGRLLEPIAITGMGCRYPGGVSDPESFWKLLDSGGDAITEVPPERWDIDAVYDPDPDAPGKMMTRSGGFVSDVDRFDAEFFGIAPREAQKVDPQQRLLLETSWEAIEASGITPADLDGTNTGVFVGMASQGYGALAAQDLAQLDGHIGTGNSMSVGSGRISYVLGLQGPSMTVDTACSSSLVTIHLACQALRQGECNLALAGGVTVMVTPGSFVEFSRLRGLAPDGRIKSFAKGADGTAWADGCGMLVLERLSDARRNGHPILALIKGSAVNQDGRSNGLTAPNGPSQEAVVRRALAQAGVRPADVQYVECHGTGTTLGDPIEAQALGTVLAEGRSPEQPAIIGSVKTNIGHTQQAAGVAGIIKVVEALKHQRIPKNLHFDAPSPHIGWEDLPIKVAVDSVAWPHTAVPRIAGVSSFGFSGTNAHVVLEEAPAREEKATPSRSAELVVLSGKTEGAVQGGVEKLREHLRAHPAQGLADVAYSLATTRTHHEHRLSLTAETREGLEALLEKTAQGQAAPGVARTEPKESGKLAWLFTGQGAQRLGMGRGLYEEWPVFRQALDEAWRALDAHLPVPLREVMWAEAGTARAQELDQTGYTQAALFAFEISLGALWRSWGVEPELVAGHSVGELSAAYFAGVFSLADAARLVAARGQLMQALPAGGAMVAIAASEEAVRAELVKSGTSGAVTIAAINSPTSVVVSGEHREVLAVAESFASRGVRTKALAVSHAFHSSRMEPMLEAFRRVAESVTYRAPQQVAVVSNVSGKIAGSELATPEYWVRHVREAVRFADGVQALYGAGARRFLEIGPKPTLLGLVPECLPEGKQDDVQLWASLRTERPEASSVLDALGSYHASGGAVEWKGVFPNGGRRVELPTYSWQRERYWFEQSGMTARSGEATGHPLLGVRVPMAGVKAAYESVVSVTERPWLADSRLGDRIVLGVAALCEWLGEAAEYGFEGQAAEVSSLVMVTPLVLAERGGVRVQIVVGEAHEGAHRVTLYSQPAQSGDSSSPWTMHAHADVRVREAAPPATVDVASLRARCTESVDVERVYDELAAAGLPYGPSFRGMESLHRAENEAVAQVALAADVADAEEAEKYGVHPALLDAAFHVTGVLASVAGKYVPFAVDRFVVHRSGARAATVHARRVKNSDSSETARFDVVLADAQGGVLAEVQGVQCRPAQIEVSSELAPSVTNAMYRVDWVPAAAAAAASAAPTKIRGRWVVVCARSDARAEALVEKLRAAGADASRVERAQLSEALPADHVVCLWSEPEPRGAEAALHLASEGLAVVHTLIPQAVSPKVWWVTSGAVAARDAEPLAVASAGLWGLGRAFAQEYLDLGCKLIDLEPGADVASLLLREAAATDDEQEVAWRGGQRLVARLVRASSPTTSPRTLRTDGTVLITGGLGALGLHVARWLAKRGVKHLLLTGRRGKETPGAMEAAAELEALGATVTIAAVDVAQRQAVASLLGSIAADKPLRGIVHAAGLADPGLLPGQTPERLARLMAPKVDAAFHLDALTQDADLDFFVLFSSIASTLGIAAAGASTYAATNACLDALAAHRKASGRVGQSLAWGPWNDRGMAATADDTKSRLARNGLKAISDAQGLALVGASLERAEACLVLVPIDLRAATKAFGGTVPPLWRSLIQTRPAATHAAGSWAQELAQLPEDQRLETVLETVRAQIARALALAGPDAVDANRPLKELGLDSLMAVELRNALAKRAGIKLSTTLVFDYPTSTAIARHLLEQLVDRAEAPVDAAPSAAQRPADNEPIAIVGIGCRYPGGVVDLESFWQLVDGGVDGITEIPPERWDVDAFYDANPNAPGKMFTRSGGFVRDVDRFDANFFDISPEAARMLDPQQRLLLETTWEALEGARIAPPQLAGSNAGVFVGITAGDYGRIAAGELSQLDENAGIGNSASLAAGRISYVLGLHGPSMTVDTACSSSMVAVHLACQALRQSECNVALAGGVQLMLTPSTLVMFSRVDASIAPKTLAPDGHVKAFTKGANGNAISEGCGIMVLERLSDARRNGHPILAVIRGSAVHQYGRSNGMNSTSGPSLESVLRRSLAQAGIRPADVNYVECQAIGTAVGDAIEVNALGRVLGEGRAPERPLILGSVKTNIGHALAASGVSGMIKVVQAMKYGRIPKNLHFGEPNPDIPWDELSVKVASEPLDWPRGGAPRIAAVNSSGMSGTHANVVLEEAPVAENGAPGPKRIAELVLVSARTEPALQASIEKLSKHLEEHPQQTLGDLAFSLATTRTHHEHRLAVTADSREALHSLLDKAQRGQVTPGVVRGQTPASGKLAWLFTGQGSQRLGMGRGLYEEWPVFRQALDEAWAAFAPHLPTPLREVMWAQDGSARAAELNQTSYAQAAVFAFEIALGALWRSWGIRPSSLAGYGIGELAAAYLAGVFSLADGARLVAARGQLMQALPAGGTMVAIAASEEDVRAELEKTHASSSIAIAAVNGPMSVVISGEQAAALAMAARFTSRGVRTKPLAVSHAFHSPLMEPMLEGFRRVAESVEYHAPRIAMVSNVSGKIAGPELATAEYWVQHVRRTVRFADGMRALYAAGARRFLELGPQPRLLKLASECLTAPGESRDDVQMWAALHRQRSEPCAVVDALGSYHASGGEVDWKGVFPTGRQSVELPTYPWQRERYWVDASSAAPSAVVGRVPTTNTEKVDKVDSTSPGVRAGSPTAP